MALSLQDHQMTAFDILSAVCASLPASAFSIMPPISRAARSKR
jgi:hypothetical protein